MQSLDDYKKSLLENDKFWAEKAKEILQWIEPWHSVSKWTFEKPIEIKWFLGAKLNVSSNCIDRHLKTSADKAAFTWVPEDPNRPPLVITYQKLYEEVNRLSNGLRKLGVQKGDRVTLYLPMIPEAVYAMLACTRIGAIHSVIFAGFSPQSVADRIDDCKSEWVITADEGIRGGKNIPLKRNIDQALKLTDLPKKVIVVKNTGNNVDWVEDRDIWYESLVKKESTTCEPEVMDSEDPLFILYTSGSTGRPKGVLHTSGGYLLYAAYTHQQVFNVGADELYWCAADIGWITGHSYIVYGPLANGISSVLYEGLPTYPSASRLWEIVDQLGVTALYTAPTLIRALMREGEAPVRKTSRKSLKLLGSVGEPINPEAWLWYRDVVGDGRCPIMDTWWQTETGGILISPTPDLKTLKPGSATLPLPGIEPVILSDQGKPVDTNTIGHLCLKRSWPGQMRTVFGDHQRFYTTYFSQFPGLYYSGDECRQDEDGYYWILGRADDVINVSGHRLGTAEVESAIVHHQKVAEAAVVGFPHEIKGQGIYAFVTLKSSVEPTDALKNEILNTVREQIGALAKPDIIQWAPALPKTRSGKIMRRILKKIAANEVDSLGDTTTLADPEVVKALTSARIQTK